jgi:hypothetical protein
MALYQKDPNNSKKQIPLTNPVLKRVGYAITPADGELVKRPSHVIVNVEGTYAFAYESGSVGTYITGSVVEAAAGGIKLEINPVAWRQTVASAGTIGDITFVYRSR